MKTDVLTPVLNLLMITDFLTTSTFWLFPGCAILLLFDWIWFFLKIKWK